MTSDLYTSRNKPPLDPRSYLHTAGLGIIGKFWRVGLRVFLHSAINLLAFHFLLASTEWRLRHTAQLNTSFIHTRRVQNGYLKFSLDSEITKVFSLEWCGLSEKASENRLNGIRNSGWFGYLEIENQTEFRFSEPP